MSHKEKEQKQKDLDMVKPTQLADRKRAARFKLVGGPYHDMTFRLYPPWDVLEFPDGSRYEIHAPIRKNGRWVYVHTTTPQLGE